MLEDSEMTTNDIPSIERATATGWHKHTQFTGGQYNNEQEIPGISLRNITFHTELTVFSVLSLWRVKIS